MDLLAKAIVIVLGSAGFLLANHIRKSKRAPAPLVCPLNGSCETVITSRYSKLFGIPLEYLGMLYYGIIALSYALFAFYPELLPEPVAYAILSLTTFAFLFSLYLTAVQAVLLKHWCTWCLISAGLCTLIFILVVFISDMKIFEFIRALGAGI